MPLAPWESAFCWAASSAEAPGLPALLPAALVHYRQEAYTPGLNNTDALWK
jgi:hypothetical protein